MSMNEIVETLQSLKSSLQKKIYGQDAVIDNILLAIVANGHVLLEGMPGTAKTRAVKSVAEALKVEMGRVQFTPDLLPSDVVGYETLEGDSGEMHFSQGPIFKNIVLADEINRAPPKVQSALLEAMEERHVTVGGTSHDLPPLFIVMATQNPIEQEGTYPLPEAQLDRFLLKVIIDYPEAEAERFILRLVRGEEHSAEVEEIEFNLDHIFQARRAIADIFVSDVVEKYMVELIMSTRHPENYPDSKLAEWIRVGVSPRATIALDRCARASALIAGRDYVDPDDVRGVLPEVMGHRLVLSYKAAAAGVDQRGVVSEVLRVTPFERGSEHGV